MFQKKSYKIIEDIKNKDKLSYKKINYYKSLINILVNDFSNYNTDYRNDDVFYFIINNINNDYKKRDMFYILSKILTVNKKKYTNLVRLYDYKLFNVDVNKS